MILSTASEVISLIRRLEKLGSAFYEATAEAHPMHRATFQAFAAENRQFSSQVERTYYGVISDALEGGFAFRIPKEEYDIEPPPRPPKGLGTLVEKAVQVEEKALALYEKAARQSKPLMADIHRVLELVARKRRPRVEALRALITTDKLESPRE